MAKRKAYKAAKKNKKVKELKKQQNLIDRLRFSNGRTNIELLSDEEKRMVSIYVIGRSYCPCCKRGDVSVLNDNGLQGQPRFDYLINHTKPRSTKILCEGSEKMIYDFKK